jgi:hypothetical protein
MRLQSLAKLLALALSPFLAPVFAKAGLLELILDSEKAAVKAAEAAKTGEVAKSDEAAKSGTAANAAVSTRVSKIYDIDTKMRDVSTRSKRSNRILTSLNLPELNHVHIPLPQDTSNSGPRMSELISGRFGNARYGSRVLIGG